MKKDVLIVGTRASALARWQADHVVARLRALSPGLDMRTRLIKTEGDRIVDRPLAEVGGKGLFVKEIEAALLAGEIDLAVHSLKDLPGELPHGLTLAAILERADPRDALLIRSTSLPRRPADGAGEAEGWPSSSPLCRALAAATGGTEGGPEEQPSSALAALPPGARVGTSSLRRRAQLLAARPDVQVVDLRGNVDTRLAKLERGDYDAIILAVSGLVRLGSEAAIDERLPVAVMVPAPGQGALAVEVRAGDETTCALVGRLDHGPTRQATDAERAFQARLGGGCQAPAGAYAEVHAGRLDLIGLVISPDGARLVREELIGPAAQAASLGAALAARLLHAGAAAILEELSVAQ